HSWKLTFFCRRDFSPLCSPYRARASAAAFLIGQWPGPPTLYAICRLLGSRTCPKKLCQLGNFKLVEIRDRIHYCVAQNTIGAGIRQPVKLFFDGGPWQRRIHKSWIGSLLMAKNLASAEINTH